MLAKRRQIALSEIELNSESKRQFLESEVMRKIAVKISDEKLPLLLTAYPVVVVRKADGRYQVVAGKRSFLLARAKIVHTEKIEVTVVDVNDRDVEDFAAYDDVLAPLALHADLDVLEERAKRHIENGSLYRIARDLNDKKQWREIRRSDLEPGKPKLETPVPGATKRRGRKPKAQVAADAASAGNVDNATPVPDIAGTPRPAQAKPEQVADVGEQPANDETQAHDSAISNNAGEAAAQAN